LIPIFDCFERIECPAFLGKNDGGGLGPHEGFGIGVVVVEIVVDRSLKIATLVKTPRRMRLRVISPKKRSTRLSQEALVGVKWSLKRLCLASQASTAGVLCVA
jgi:hypothetical protein